MHLYNGDCLEILADKDKIPDHSVSFILCDLPYGTTKNHWDTIIDLEKIWGVYKRVLKPGGCVALWAQIPFSVTLAMSNPEWLRYEWIVEKTNPTGFLNAKKMPMKAHENVLIFYETLPTYHPQMTHGHERKVSLAKYKRNCKETTDYGRYNLASYDSTDRYPRDVITFPWDKQKIKLHPTEKPVAANEYFIRTYTDPGDIVLDSCMGSGSTGIACINTGREFIGIEQNNDYFKVAKEWIDQELRQMKLIM